MTMYDAHNLDQFNWSVICVRVRLVENQVHAFHQNSR